MSDDFPTKLQRSIAVAGQALAEALPPSTLQAETLTQLEQSVGNLERAMFSDRELEDAGVQQSLRALEERAADGARKAVSAGHALSMSVVALATALKVYTPGSPQASFEPLVQAVVLAHAYAAQALALPVEPDEPSATHAADRRDGGDLKLVVRALIEIVRDRERRSGTSPIDLLSRCFATAAQSPNATTPWALMRIYGSQIAACVTVFEPLDERSLEERAARVVNEYGYADTTARDAFARSLEEVAEAVSKVVSAEGFEPAEVSERLVHALGLAAVASAALRSGE